MNRGNIDKNESGRASANDEAPELGTGRSRWGSPVPRPDAGSVLRTGFGVSTVEEKKDAPLQKLVERTNFHLAEARKAIEEKQKKKALEAAKQDDVNLTNRSAPVQAPANTSSRPLNTRSVVIKVERGDGESGLNLTAMAAVSSARSVRRFDFGNSTNNHAEAGSSSNPPPPPPLRQNTFLTRGGRGGSNQRGARGHFHANNPGRFSDRVRGRGRGGYHDYDRPFDRQHDSRYDNHTNAQRTPSTPPPPPAAPVSGPNALPLGSGAPRNINALLHSLDDTMRREMLGVILERTLSGQPAYPRQRPPSPPQASQLLAGPPPFGSQVRPSANVPPADNSAPRQQAPRASADPAAAESSASERYKEGKRRREKARRQRKTAARQAHRDTESAPKQEEKEEETEIKREPRIKEEPDD